jgi:phenylacetate-CoA ligase
MSDALLRLYHRLPAPARSIAASLRGLYLRSWRFGAETERLVAEALEREGWSATRWRQWQEDRLAYVLHRAATRVPYYRERWTARRRRGDRASWEDLDNWPIVEKEEVRANPRAFVADDCDLRRMYHEHTSGTSGTPLTLWWSRPTVRAWYALAEARLRVWHGVSRDDRWAQVGGQLVVPVARQTPPFWVWNAAFKQLYMSSYHLAPEFIPYFLRALRRYRIRYLLGYTSSLYALAREALSAGVEDLNPVVAITNAEPLLAHQRETISRGFGCPVRESYGMAELVAAASECSEGLLHLWPEVGWIEVMEEDRPVEPGVVGDLVCTGLLNQDMPLIRYRVGDRGALSSSKKACGCGRMLPALAQIEGRIDDVLVTRDGRCIGRLDPVFKGRAPIREAQVIQESLDLVRVRYVPAPGFTAADGQSIVDRLRARMGPIYVRLEEIDAIARTRNGKFRSVICNLSREEREAILQH